MGIFFYCMKGVDNMTRTKAYARIDFLDKQISMLMDSLGKSTGANMYAYAYLLQKCTDEWCELVEKYGLPMEAERS